MSYNVYTNHRDGRSLVASNVSWRDAEIYRETCRNVVIHDTANDWPELPEDRELFEQYGIASKKVLESAKIVLTCMAGGAILLGVAVIYAAIS